MVYGYEYGKLETDFQPRHNWTFRTDQALLNCAHAFAECHNDWDGSLVIPRPSGGDRAQVKVGEVASGDKVVDDPSNTFFASVMRAWPKLVAVEMEGVGAATATEHAQSSGIPVGFMMVRGISDLPRSSAGGQERGRAERDKWKAYAADTAAAFTVGLIADGLPLPPQRPAVVTPPAISLTEQLRSHNLHDVSSEQFGQATVARDLGVAFRYLEPPSLASSFVIFGAFPTQKVSQRPTDVIRTVRERFSVNKWWNPTEGPLDQNPRYWSPNIMSLPSRIRTGADQFVAEDQFEQHQPLIQTRLAISGGAEVLHASASGLIDRLRSGETVFSLGRILARLWKFAALSAQLQKDLQYTAETQLFLALVNTGGSHLGGNAKPWDEPGGPHYVADSFQYDWVCHDPNVFVCRPVELLAMTPKQQPSFLREFAEEVSQAYNHEEPRCFDAKTGFIPSEYLK